MKQKLFSMLALLLMAATGAWAQGYTVTLKDGTEDADNWTIEPKEGLSENDQVTITYTGSKRVKSVTAVKKAAVETMEFVEFTSGGKKVKFANMNLGATSVADGTKSYGDYYAWGATETFATVDYSTATPTVTAKNNGGYSQANAPYFSGTSYTKYKGTDNLTTLEAADDVVTATMGEGYRMPTQDDFMTLIAACGGTGNNIAPSSISSGTAYTQGIYWVAGATSAVTIGGDEYKANGVLFVQNADTHVFLPAAGNINGTELSSWGSYWSSTLSTNDTQYANGLYFGNNIVLPNCGIIRYFGVPVRPVQEGTLLSTITSNYTAQDGETLYGKLGSNVKISIADGATVKLKDVTINGENNSSYKWAGITCEGDATITLEGANTLKGFYKDYPGIYVPREKTLTIEGEGSLKATSNGDASGIGAGAGYDNSCGNIVINGGNITATGNGSYNAGIGGGDAAHAGNITINGGTVTATGTSGAAGIGGGGSADVGNITITGGTVTATGGTKSAGIGGSNQRCFGDILISGGTVTATGGSEAAGIGGGRRTGRYGDCGSITIKNTVTQVTATKGSSAPNSIGAGNNKDKDITVIIEAGANVIQN